MPLLPKSKSPTANLILAIVILNALGTLLLFIKTDLDARQMSREIGIIQQQLTGSPKASRTMPTMPPPMGAGLYPEGTDRISAEASNEISEIIRQDQLNQAQ